MGVNLRAPGCEKEAGHRGTWCETPFLGNVQKRHHRDKASLLDGEGEWLLLGMGTPQGDVTSKACTDLTVTHHGCAKCH